MGKFFEGAPPAQLKPVQKWVKTAIEIGISRPEIVAVTTIKASTLGGWITRFDFRKIADASPLEKNRHLLAWTPLFLRQIDAPPGRKQDDAAGSAPARVRIAKTRVEDLDAQGRRISRHLKALYSKRREVVRNRALLLKKGLDPLLIARSHKMKEHTRGVKDGKQVHLDTDRDEIQRTPLDTAIDAIDVQIARFEGLLTKNRESAERLELERSRAAQDGSSGANVDKLAALYEME